MLDVLVCTNLVNYAVAVRGVRNVVHGRALLLYEPRRFERQHVERVSHLPIGIWSLRLVRGLARLGQVRTLYLPHHRFNRRIAAAAADAHSIAYLDDGLDTLRREPRNFELDRITGRPPYFTFRDYGALPGWLQDFQVQPVCGLLDLATVSPRSAMALDGIDHVFFESPGLQPAAVITSFGLDVRRTLVVRHPIAAKRSTIPPDCRTVSGTDFNPEATLLASQGKAFYFGETMALVFALHAGPAARNRVRAQLSAQQLDNLAVLRLRPAEAAGAVQLFGPSD
ncbi:hypothetical protein [Ideonella sp. BN130291]|uniref:hypothetical protein n=1 Tax=Ideonella sp. BN130291 TaxID=3112940 RepID=UPI002E277199|nr:hypothetical protein [Ideonella sp. BN130291]